MSKSKIIALTLFVTFLLTSNATAKTESYLMALGIVESFDIETKALIKEAKWNGPTRAFYKRSATVKSEATNNIKSVRWSEEPSPKRFSRIYSIVEQYTGSIVEAADDLAGNLPEKKRPAIDEAIVKLKSLEIEFLEELKKTSASERKQSWQHKPSSVIDRSPYEEKPGDQRGIYER
ncbi:MAG: hypothetical protein V3V95_00625 [Thermodesulfobacteriota bacterium]